MVHAIRYNTVESPPDSPVMDRATVWIVSVFCIIKLGLHLLADYHSGFQGDELLHIETGHHLDFGYMEFPPLIALLAFLQNLLQSDSVFVHHIFPHIAMILIFVYVAKTVVVLGGGGRAVFLVLLCLLPVMGRSQQLFQPVVFSQLFWVMGYYYLLRYVQTADRRYLWFLTGAVCLAFMNKYDTAFFIFGLLALLFFKPIRQLLVTHRFWQSILIFLLFISPNVIWQIRHDFPVLEMFDRLYETQLEQNSRLSILGKLMLSLNPVSLLISVPAIVAMFHHSMKRYRVVSLSICLSTIALILAKGKAYYFYPIALTVLPFGGVFWESVILERKKWLLYPATFLLLISGAVLLPFSLPVTSFENYLLNEYRYDQDVKEERYSDTKWKETLTALQEVYLTLPFNERTDALIWGKHYGQAGAVTLYGDKYELPEVFSLHGSFYKWLPEGAMTTTVLALRYSRETGVDFFEPYFEEVTAVRTWQNPYADEAEQLWQTIFVCRNPKQDFETLKLLFAGRVFE